MVPTGPKGLYGIGSVTLRSFEVFSEIRIREIAAEDSQLRLLLLFVPFAAVHLEPSLWQKCTFPALNDREMLGMDRGLRCSAMLAHFSKTRDQHRKSRSPRIAAVASLTLHGTSAGGFRNIV